MVETLSIFSKNGCGGPQPPSSSSQQSSFWSYGSLSFIVSARTMSSMRTKRFLLGGKGNMKEISFYCLNLLIIPDHLNWVVKDEWLLSRGSSHSPSSSVFGHMASSSWWEFWNKKRKFFRRWWCLCTSTASSTHCCTFSSTSRWVWPWWSCSPVRSRGTGKSAGYLPHL